MANGCLAALFGFGSKPNPSNSQRDERRRDYLGSDSTPVVIATDDMNEGDLHSGPEGYSPNTAYPDTFYGSGGHAGGYEAGGYDGGGADGGGGGGD